MAFQNINNDDFQSRVLDGEGLVFVKFSADRCGPCKAVAPVLDSLSKDYDEEVNFFEVDIDAAPEIARQQGIRGVPHFLIFNKGELVSREMGAQSRTRFAEMIEAAIEGASA